MNIEKFEIMQSIQDIIDNSNENKSIDKLIKLRDKLYNVNSVDCKFSATAYDLINLRTKELKTDLISGLSSLTERI